MLISNTSERLNYLMQTLNLKQIDILNKCLPICEKYNVKMGRNHISQYVSGKVKPNQEKLSILALALNVSEAWLMGYDVPMVENTEEQQNKKIGERIKEIRESHNITLEEFANEFHITVEDLKQYESGKKKVPFSLVKAIGDYFGITTYQQTGLTIPAPVGNDFGVTMNVLKATDRWNKEVGVVQFSDDELTELINFANYLISKRKE